jgi:hypothetical protein
MVKPKAIICDIDGTLANHTHRLHYVKPFGYSCDGENRPCDIEGRPFKKNWKAFFEAQDKDTPNEWCVKIINGLIEEYGIVPIYLTGRPELYRYITEKQIQGWVDPSDYQLYMKPDQNCKDGEAIWKSGAEFKKEVYWERIEPHYDVLFALDDDEMCCRMWKEEGVQCLQVT